MYFTKLNNGWNANPNAPYPYIKINGSNLLLSFYMNYFIYEGYSHDDIGIIDFHYCIQFRFGGPNDEGFFRYGDKYKPYGIEWGEFYCIQGSDWKTSFDDPIFISNNSFSEEK
ncbi:MAG: hypothetical protein FWF04_03340, partial [Clostridiales bacterium]|nr:hypothetical protein [Clostridiales bacterium]